MNVALEKPPIEFNNLAKGQMLTRSFVQASCGLNELHGVKTGTMNTVTYGLTIRVS
jgi:hypothetical protein